MHLGQIRTACEDMAERLAKKPTPPQVRRKDVRDLIALVDDVLAEVHPGNPEANEIAKYALLNPVIQQGIAEKLKG